jgi:YidC/Oxa1 family membrane protein insertase
MYVSQKVMMKSQTTAVDPSQQAMQKSLSKIMPIMITGMFVFIPIPAGVMLYLVTSNVIQLLQTIIIDRQLDKESAAETPNVIEAEVVEKSRSMSHI